MKSLGCDIARPDPCRRYTKEADWLYVYSCAKETTDVQFLGTGDVFSFAEWEDRLTASEELLTTCTIVAAARIKPWIFTGIIQIPGPMLKLSSRSRNGVIGTSPQVKGSTC